MHHVMVKLGACSCNRNRNRDMVMRGLNAGARTCAMVKRTIIAVGAIFIAVIFLAPHEAWAAGPGAGRSAAHGASSAHRFQAAKFARSQHRRFRRFRYPWVWTDGCAVYGACYDVPSEVEPYDVPDRVISGSPPYRPSCGLEEQTRVVPSEDGGERKITIIRCLTPIVAPAANSGNALSSRGPQ